MAADNLVVGNERCDRLPESPGQLAVRAGLAFVLLRAFGMRREHDGFAGRRDSVGNGGLGGRCAHQRTGKENQGQRPPPWEWHGGLSESVVISRSELSAVAQRATASAQARKRRGK